ncbi:DMT family transporter [Desulforhopalus singaporensis]|uniref:EamA domain-containing membrane protein RarD n=1 Tax=Desulforhopalus singaporensis TaxID=91360 RepID=A0A1H0PXK4_9BACT|nr:DMT family transporter [Desulforhopalus singaporensis]SDP09803.1 EamA domain-containing membrane protein RarD [Desulforhopalus singaporensis]
MDNQKKSYLLALTTVGLWSTIATVSKLTLGLLTVIELLFYSSAVSLCVLFVILVVQQKLVLLMAISPREFLVSFGFGFLNPFSYYLTIFAAYDLLPAQQAQIINYTWAITMTVLSIPILGQRVSRNQWLAVAVCYAGVLVVATRGDLLSLKFDTPKGVAVALLSTVIWALYWLLNARDKRDPVVGLFLNFLCALPFTGCYFLWTGGGKISVKGFVGAAYIGFFEMGIAFVLWLTALKLTSSSAKLANLIFIAPFLSLFLIHFLVGEKIFISSLAGLLLVVTGLVIQAVTTRKQK